MARRTGTKSQGPSDNEEAGTSQHASEAEILLLEVGVISEMWEWVVSHIFVSQGQGHLIVQLS